MNLGVRLTVAAPLLAALFFARPSGADEALARQHFRRGVELYDKKEYVEALEAFQAAYREKPSPGIKQNIGLSYDGMGQPVLAAMAFDEALDEGRDTLRPETRAAIEQKLAEIDKVVATLDLRILAVDDRRSLADQARVTIDGAPLALGAARRHIRLAPGIHVVTAHVDGFVDPPEKKLAVVVASPVDATFELRTAIGAPATAMAPNTTRPIAEAPPPYVAPDRTPPPKPKRFYGALTIAIDTETLHLSNAVGGPVEPGLRLDFSGLAGGVRGGYRLSRYFAAEAHFELGKVSKSYKLVPTDVLQTDSSLVHWQATPVIRFTSPGAVRFTTGTGIGVHGSSFESRIPDKGATVTKSGSGTAASWLLDFGGQVDVGPVFFEGVLFFDVNGVGTVRERQSGERILLASPAARIGIRLGFAVLF